MGGNFEVGVITAGSGASRVSRYPDFFPRFLLLLPALLRAIATACFCGLPAFISVLMFELIVLWEEPFFVPPICVCSAATDHQRQSHSGDKSERLHDFPRRENLSGHFLTLGESRNCRSP
jgi:hypothetical protein